MEYIKEYTNQLMALYRGEKIKINVHFIVSEPLSSFCVETNKEIGKLTAGLIDFGVESIILPHISLYMGFVDSYEMLKRVFQSVELYANEVKPFTFDATTMNFRGVSSSAPQYLFIDSKQNDYLMQQKSILDKMLSGISYPNDWNMKDERAHITVGCYKQLQQSVREMVDLSKKIPSCRISQIGVSLSGKRGVCLSLLKVFDLDKRNSKSILV